MSKDGRSGEPLAMIHVRLVSPPDITPGLVDLLASNAGVFDLIVLEGVARNPDGDAVQFDVINAEANGVLQDLRARGVTRARIDRHRGHRRRAVGPSDGRGSPGAASAEPLADLGAGRGPDPRRRTVSAELVPLARDRRADRRRRHLHELADPDRRRHGRRPGVRGDHQRRARHQHGRTPFGSAPGLLRSSSAS